MSHQNIRTGHVPGQTDITVQTRHAEHLLAQHQPQLGRQMAGHDQPRHGGRNTEYNEDECATDRAQGRPEYARIELGGLQRR